MSTLYFNNKAEILILVVHLVTEITEVILIVLGNDHWGSRFFIHVIVAPGTRTFVCTPKNTPITIFTY